MNLTAHTDYAFRTMMLLAVRHPKSATIQEIATRYSISRGHLMVLVHKLGNRGFLENIRGRGGGIRLARPASEIRLDEIVRATEPGFRLVECFEAGSNQCLIAPHCRLQGILGEALDAWFSILAKYTLQDLVDRNRSLAGLLSIMEPVGAPGRHSHS
jgi:Rrf2 family nitric oxide-sensitive transcriptional repressor